MLGVLAFLLVQAGAVPRDLAPILGSVVRSSGVPALGAAIITSEGIEAIGAVGVRRMGGRDSVSVDDQWHIGSCTKAFTATLVARLAARGVVRWDLPIGAVLKGPMHPAWRQVPLGWLLVHRSGAPASLDEALWQAAVRRGGSPSRQRRWYVEQSLQTPPSAQPNTATVYSNAGYLIAGVMLEIVAGAPWEELVRRELFGPLGMRRTGFGAPGRPGRVDQPLGHVRGDSGWTPRPVGPGADNPAATGPAGTIHTTLGDWARFVQAHLRGARGDTTYLPAEAWRRLHSPGVAGAEYSPGWVVGDEAWAGGRYLHHLGSNGFWLAEATLMPARDRAVLLVANGADDALEAPFTSLLASLAEPGR